MHVLGGIHVKRHIKKNALKFGLVYETDILYVQMILCRFLIQFFCQCIIVT